MAHLINNFIMNMDTYKIVNIDLLNEVIEAKRTYAKASTIKYYVSTVAKLKEYLGENANAVIDNEVCHGFAAYLCEHMKESSARAYLQQLTALLNDAWERGWIEHSPISKPSALMPKRATAEKAYLTESELMCLYHTPCGRESTRMAFLFSCFTGLSYADIETIEFDHIHHDGRRLVIVKPVDNHHLTRIPLGHMAMQVLNEIEAHYQPSDDNRIFHLKDRSTVSSDLRKWTADAGLSKNVTFSYGKNSFCTLALQAGVDINKLAYWNGNTPQSIESLANPAGNQPRNGSIAAFDNLFA